MNPPLPCRTHAHTDLSDFSRGDLPFVGTSKHTGDVPVGKQGGMVSVRLGSLANRAGAGWLFDTSPWLAPPKPEASRRLRARGKG